ncbi:PEP-CTERM sorting domain-containing protein [Coleofasciculus sp. C1-SOL-03]
MPSSATALGFGVLFKQKTKRQRKN